MKRILGLHRVCSKFAGFFKAFQIRPPFLGGCMIRGLSRFGYCIQKAPLYLAKPVRVTGRLRQVLHCSLGFRDLKPET